MINVTCTCRRLVYSGPFPTPEVTERTLDYKTETCYRINCLFSLLQVVRLSRGHKFRNAKCNYKRKWSTAITAYTLKHHHCRHSIALFAYASVTNFSRICIRALRVTEQTLIHLLVWMKFFLWVTMSPHKHSRIKKYTFPPFTLKKKTSNDAKEKEIQKKQQHTTRLLMLT